MFKNVSGQKIGAQLISATDGSEFTGSVTVYVTGDAGTQAAGSVSSGACTHEGHGYHTYVPAQAETNYDLIAFTFVGSGAVPVTVQLNTKFDAQKINGTDQTARDLGASVLLSSGSGAGQLDFTSGVVKANATQWLGGTIPAVNVPGVPLVDMKYILGTVSAGAVGYIGIDWGAVANKTTTNALTGTTIAATQQVDLNTIKTQAVTCSAGVTIGAFVGNATHAIAVDASGSVTVVTNNDKTGYSLTQSFPTNFAALAITSGGIVQADLQTIKTQAVTCSAGVTVGPFVGNATHALVVDSSGYVTVTQAFPANFSSLEITSGGIVQADLQTIKMQAVTCAGSVTIPAATLASTANITAASGVALTSAYDPAKTASQAGDAMTLTSGERNSIATALLDLANGIETSLTLRNALRLIAAAAAGKLSGAGTAVIVIRNALADSKDRITAGGDVDGNRTSITLDLS